MFSIILKFLLGVVYDAFLLSLSGSTRENISKYYLDPRPYTLGHLTLICAGVLIPPISFDKIDLIILRHALVKILTQ